MSSNVGGLKEDKHLILSVISLQITKDGCPASNVKLFAASATERKAVILTPPPPISPYTHRILQMWPGFLPSSLRHEILSFDVGRDIWRTSPRKRPPFVLVTDLPIAAPFVQRSSIPRFHNKKSNKQKTTGVILCFLLRASTCPEQHKLVLRDLPVSPICYITSLVDTFDFKPKIYS